MSHQTNATDLESTNGDADHRSERVAEYEELISAVQPLLTDFIARSEPENDTNGHLVDAQEPHQLEKILEHCVPSQGFGAPGLVDFTRSVLKYSVNTWHQGFMSKLYASPNPVGLVAELILATLNTNVHVMNVSPALTVIEKAMGKALATLFGLEGERSGGLVQQGGSSANLSALVIARNTMFPDVTTEGSTGKKFVLFTSSHGHYSFEKAAQICGLGSKAVWSVAVDKDGLMDTIDLETQVAAATNQGYTPFFVNATAGTTVLGSYDPMTDIGCICKKHGLWFHVDASWGGAVVFSQKLKYKMQGAELADTITYNPHKMLNVPVTCSFLLISDLMKAWRANTLPANYLFHSENAENDMELPNDLADMTLQCGRRGDALKLALSWIYYGTTGFESRISNAFDVAAHFAQIVEESPNLQLVSTKPPPCLQVCFYYTRSGHQLSAEENTRYTKAIAKRLWSEDFAVDFAPGVEGHFLRAVISLETLNDTVERLAKTVERLGFELGKS